MDRATWKAEIRPLLAPVILPLVFFWRELLGLSVFAGFDFTHLILPFQQFARESVRAGRFPEWNPYLFAGFPQLAEGEGGFFYPGNLLFLLPGDQTLFLAWTVVLHLILSGCLMYAFLRSRGASRATAGWLAVFYQFLPGLILRFETVGLFEAAAWLPGFYWACEQAVDRASKQSALGSSLPAWTKWAGFAAAQIAFMLLAGSSQMAFYAMLGALFYLAGVSLAKPGYRPRALWALATFVVAAAFGALLASIQLIPTSKLASLSFRVQAAQLEFFRLGTWLTLPRLASLFLFPAVRVPTDILSYVSSLGYVGLLPFLLVGVTLNLHRRNMNPILPPFLLFFFGILLAFGLNFSAYQDLITYPGFNLFRALGRMILPTQVALFALAAVGLDALFQLHEGGEIVKKIGEGIWATAAIALVLTTWFLLSEGFPLTGFQTAGLIVLGVAAVVVGVGLFAYSRTRRTSWLVTLLLIWLGIHLALLCPARSALTMDTRSFGSVKETLRKLHTSLPARPDRPPRVLIGASGDQWSPLLSRLAEAPFSSGSRLPIPAFGNELSMGEIGVLNAYTPLVPDRWFRVAHEYAASGLKDAPDISDRLGRVLEITLTDAIVAPRSLYSGDWGYPVPVDLGPLFPADRYISSRPPEVPFAGIAEYVEAWHVMDWEWFKHWIVQPAYVPGEWVCVEIDEDTPLPDGMEWSEPLTGMRQVNPKLPVWGGMQLDETAKCEVVSAERLDGRFLIRTRCDSPCWLVVRESYMPGWKASIDGEAGVVVPADYLFCAVPIPAGEHLVEMIYATPGLRRGAILSAFGWAFWLLAMIAALAAPREKAHKSSDR